MAGIGEAKFGIHQYIPYIHAPGDATADLVYAFQRAFRDWGFRSDIYSLESDSEVTAWLNAREQQPDPGDLLIYHYACGSDITSIFAQLNNPRLVYYHNVTPPEFVRPFHAPLADDLAMGREQVRALNSLPALVPSDFSRQELLTLGFRDVQVVPLLLDFSRLSASVHNPAGEKILASRQPNECVWLTVGRLAPNKRCEDVIKAFAFYHHFINQNSRLVIIGGAKQFAAYEFNLKRLAEKLEVYNFIQWGGWVDYDLGFGAYYELASVYIHMSEHEGFGVTLLEAMQFELPVLAYASTAVPETMGESGILINLKDYESVAELVNIIHTDSNLRNKIIASQTNNLPRFEHQVILAQLKNALLRFLPSV